ncbi:hypothetical protein KC929_01255 [Patescibacteria group bacterium]|nr:hypothetical protein [Patescibacteria group bacterium]
MKKFTLSFTQWAGSILLLASKFFLGDYQEAWIVSAIGYVMIVLFNVLRNNYIILVTDVFLVISSTYGFFKMVNGKTEADLTQLDVLFIILTAVALLISIKKQYRSYSKDSENFDTKKFRFQVLATVCILPAFTLLSLRFSIGWIALLCAHFFLYKLFTHIGKSKAIVYLQVISMGIAIYKIFTIFIPTVSF